MTNTELLNTTDARDWAREFMTTWGERRAEIDEDLMIAWFANAMCAQMDHDARKWRNQTQG